MKSMGWGLCVLRMPENKEKYTRSKPTYFNYGSLMVWVILGWGGWDRGSFGAV